MVRKFTNEGRVACGLDAVFKDKRWCYICVPPLQTKSAYWGLGVVVANESGFHRIPDTWCHGDDGEEMYQHACELNRQLGISAIDMAEMIGSA